MLHHRLPNPEHWPREWVNQIHEGDTPRMLRELPDECVALAITSPPYWNMIDYGMEGQIGTGDYESYLEELIPVWKETLRVLIPNGKLAMITPVMPIRKSVINTQHTRHLKNISADIEQTLLQEIPELKRYSLFVWQKQTTEKMFGSYPYPPNIYEDNTIEFINVLVKEGKPPSISKEVKEYSKITQEEWRNLTMQVWCAYPADVKRGSGHPCPFPVVLPQRLIMMYTLRRAEEVGFGGDLVLDMFCGTGATCVAAKAMGRNYIGMELNPRYCQSARDRLAKEYVDPKKMMLHPVRVTNPWASEEETEINMQKKIGLHGKQAEDKLWDITS